MIAFEVYLSHRLPHRHVTLNQVTSKRQINTFENIVENNVLNFRGTANQEVNEILESPVNYTCEFLLCYLYADNFVTKGFQL